MNRKHFLQMSQPLRDFGAKVTNDWVPQLASMLAYNFLTSLLPLLLVLLALSLVSPVTEASVRSSLIAALPTGIGPQIVDGVQTNLRREAGLIFIIGLLTSVFASSRLFITMENCFGIILRLKGRSAVPQNVMAVGMTLLYLALIPLILGASILPGVLFQVVGLPTHRGFGAVLAWVVGILVGVGSATVLFGVIFWLVPNRRAHFQEVWKGALIAGGLLVFYELLFPLYTTALLRPEHYGSMIGLLVVALAFFYYLAFILLLGMEVNSWFGGQRETAGDLATLINEAQVHQTVRGVAGPTAGKRSENLE
ncbi:MAG: YihY/virulence factor BrkB family protein [Ktedonobacterales bacterium]|nr:YihY/virulence factor BrkB family protein [Ktedonobacterales bacterium]